MHHDQYNTNTLFLKKYAQLLYDEEPEGKK